MRNNILSVCVCLDASGINFLFKKQKFSTLSMRNFFYKKIMLNFKRSCKMFNWESKIFEKNSPNNFALISQCYFFLFYWMTQKKKILNLVVLAY